MALRTWKTKEDFAAAYDMDAEQGGHPQRRGVRLNYHRYVMLPLMARRAQLFTRFLGGVKTTRICIVGGGFGWSAEELLRLGFTDVVVTDISPYIQAAKNETEEADVRAAIRKAGLDPGGREGSALLARLNTGVRSRVELLPDDVTTIEGIQAVQRRFGGLAPEIVVTEDLLESLTDDQAVALNESLRRFSGAAVMHAVSTIKARANPGYNWKTLAEWKALLPAVMITHINSGELL